MTTNSQQRSARGEAYAEQFARQLADQIWDAYCCEFEFVPERP